MRLLTMLIKIHTAHAYLCLLVVYAGAVSEYRLNEKTSFTTYTITSHHVLHLEADKFTLGNLLFSDWYSMKTTNGNITSTIAGSELNYGYAEGIGSSARFHRINGFAQLSAYMVILIDERNSCLRSLNRRTAVTSQFAGSCTNRPSYPTDGEEPTFVRPQSIIIDQKFQDQLLVGDYWFLRSVKFIGTPIVQTLFINEFRIEDLTQDIENGYIYILSAWSLVRYDQVKNESVTLAGVHGDRSQYLALFNHEIRMNNMVALAYNVFLVSAPAEGKLILIDLSSNITLWICANMTEHSNDNLSLCGHSRPMSLALFDTTLYIADVLSDVIRAVTGEGQSLFQLYDNYTLIGENPDGMTHTLMHDGKTSELELNVTEVEINSTLPNRTAHITCSEAEESYSFNKVRRLTDMEMALISCVALLTTLMFSLLAVIALRSTTSPTLHDDSGVCQVEGDIPLEVQQHLNHDSTQHMDDSQNDPGDSETAEYTTLCHGTSQDSHVYASLYSNQC